MAVAPESEKPMSSIDVAREIAVGMDGLLRARVVSMSPDGTVVVESLVTGEEWSADVLETTKPSELNLVENDVVLVWRSGHDDDRPVVLGRIRAVNRACEDDQPDELVIEARASLVLKCGASSITIREDGKILIKGKDLVSHAQRLNRIKGGAVQIN